MPFSLSKGPSHKTRQSEYLRGQSRPRKRLQKRRPGSKNKENIYIFNYNTMKVDTCLTLLTGLDECYVKECSPSSHITEENYRYYDISKKKSKHLLDVYCHSEKADIGLWRDTKTPVFAIGQLEKSDSKHPAAQATEALAGTYHNLLPTLPNTPSPGDEKTSHQQKRIRKMKSQLSLRIQTNNQPICPAWTKDETHLGSQFDSAWAQEELAEGEYESDKESNDKSGSSTLTIAPSINPGFQICLDLLTSELTAAFFQRHPMEDQKRASRLQIQLLIEAYEDLLQQVQQRQGGLHISSVSEEEWEGTERLFEYWLDMLYYFYDLTEASEGMNSL